MVIEIAVGLCVCKGHDRKPRVEVDFSDFDERTQLKRVPVLAWMATF